LKEEASVSDVYLEQLYTFGDPKRDPRGRVISVAYFALVDASRQNIRAADDAAEAQWHSVFKPPKLAFDHRKILDYAVWRLRNKIEWTTVGYELLSKKFTLSELQRVYEVILQKPVDKRNFANASWRRAKSANSTKLATTARTVRHGSIHSKLNRKPYGLMIPR
jgi:8-oxo-dGTP diphosphatase